MSPSKIKALLKEFPFLTSGDPPLVDEEQVEEIQVARMDIPLMGVAAYHEEIKMARADINQRQDIFLLDEKGDVLAEVRPGAYFKSTIGRRVERSSQGETVGDALLRVSPADVAFIVIRQIGHRIEQNHSQGGYSAAIYKRPKRFTLEKFVEARRVLDGLKGDEK